MGVRVWFRLTDSSYRLAKISAQSKITGNAGELRALNCVTQGLTFVKTPKFVIKVAWLCLIQLISGAFGYQNVAYAQYQNDHVIPKTPKTPKEYDDAIKLLDKAPIPKNTTMLGKEATRAQDHLDYFEAFVKDKEFEEALEKLEKNIKEVKPTLGADLTKLKDQLDKLNPNSPPISLDAPIKKLLQILQELKDLFWRWGFKELLNEEDTSKQILIQLNELSEGLARLHELANGDQATKESVTQRGIYARLGDQQKIDGYVKSFGLLEPVIQKRLKLLEQQKTWAKHLAESWNKRFQTISDILDKLEFGRQENTKTFIEYLPWLVLILGGFCFAIIFIIRFFPDKLQEEWIASGQVIQFVTVTVLLIIILSLGVLRILNENTIGTLLGSIGGYVLSEGIGRAARRAAGPPPGGLPPGGIPPVGTPPIGTPPVGTPPVGTPPV